MASPTFFGDGHTPRREDPQWVIEQKILGALVDGGGGGGGSSDQVTCGAGDPVAAPSSGCGVYNNTTDGSFWAYYGGAWHELIA